MTNGPDFKISPPKNQSGSRRTLCRPKEPGTSLEIKSDCDHMRSKERSYEISIRVYNRLYMLWPAVNPATFCFPLRMVVRCSSKSTCKKKRATQCST